MRTLLFKFNRFRDLKDEWRIDVIMKDEEKEKLIFQSPIVIKDGIASTKNFLDNENPLEVNWSLVMMEDLLTYFKEQNIKGES
jgi:hypothetical protein